MLVEVRPIESKRWHGKKGQESFTRPKKIQALVNTETMQYSTGLSDEDIKMLSEKGVRYDLSSHFDSEKPHDFWDSNMAQIKLENNTMFFNTDNTLDFIKVKVMKASKYVANSMRDFDEGLYPEATHVIFDEAEEAEIKASKVAIRNKAVIECSKLSKDKKIQLVLIMKGKNLKGQSDNFVTVAIDELIAENPSEVLRQIGLDSTEVAVHALVLEAIQKNVLRKDGHKIFYFDSLLGSDVIDVIQYLMDDENQNLKLRIMEAVNE
jgi:hypothetical protein